jgi:hypothetical protein
MKSPKHFWNPGTFLGISANTAEEHHLMLEKVLDLLRARGFEIQIDPKTLKDYPCIAKDFFYGRKGDLEFKAERHPALCELEFYQNVNHENRCGGQYDFDKFEKMPYLIRLQYLNEMRYIKDLLMRHGFEDESDLSTVKPIVLRTAEEKVLHNILTSCHFRDRDESKSASYNCHDKDGKVVEDGQIKYYRDRKGRLLRGTAYHNINNMWWVVVNKHEYRNLACFELFDIDTEANRAHKAIRKSGMHNPKSRNLPTKEQIETWNSQAKKATRAERVDMANNFLKYLYSIDWISRLFQFVIKPNGRLGLVEPEGRPCFAILGMPRTRQVYDKPRELKLYPPTQMSSTESGWIKQLREYIMHGKPAVTSWFCTDRNGEGGGSYLWPEVRERLLHIGAIILPERKAG